MKAKLLLLIILNLSNLGMTAEAVKSDPSKAVYGGVTIKEDSLLKKLLSLPSVAPQYEACKKSSNSDLSQIPTCIWNKLNSDQKKEVQKLYAQEAAANTTKPGAPVDAKTLEVDVTAKTAAPTTNFTDRSTNMGTDYSSDPTVKALSEFFGKKLDEVLNGTAQDKKDKKVIIVDHTKFIDLYTSELGKSVVNAFTSYCMETESSCGDTAKSDCYINHDVDKRKTQIKANRTLLDKTDFSTSSGTKWTSCIGAISSICYDKELDNNSSISDDDKKYSIQRACLVMDFVKGARKNLMVADQQKEFYKGLDKKITIEDKNDNTSKAMNEIAATSDKLTEITSADIEKNIKQTNDQTLKEATDCESSINKAKCSKLVDANTTKNTEAIAEFGIRQLAKEATLDENLQDKNVGSYLKEEGYNDKEIATMTDPKNLQKLKDDIKNRFQQENAAIIKSMSDRIQNKTSTADGVIDDQSAGSAIGKIKTDLQSRTEDLKNLIHFDNIVASYLTTEDKAKTKSRNTASLFAEVNSMEDTKTAAQMQEKIKKNADLKNDQKDSTLSIDDINKFLLKYKP